MNQIMIKFRQFFCVWVITYNIIFLIKSWLLTTLWHLVLLTLNIVTIPEQIPILLKNTNFQDNPNIRHVCSRIILFDTFHKKCRCLVHHASYSCSVTLLWLNTTETSVGFYLYPDVRVCVKRNFHFDWLVFHQSSQNNTDVECAVFPVIGHQSEEQQNSRVGDEYKTTMPTEFHVEYGRVHPFVVIWKEQREQQGQIIWPKFIWS